MGEGLSCIIHSVSPSTLSEGGGGAHYHPQCVSERTQDNTRFSNRMIIIIQIALLGPLTFDNPGSA